jgi:hypothetical protein
MAGYLDEYGAGDERRIRTIKMTVLGVVIAIAIAVTAYLFFHNYQEKQVVKHFLTEVNSGQFQQAYQSWGCSQEHPCTGYDYGRFLEDWGPSKGNRDWKITGVDGCEAGVVITVGAPGTDSAPLWVQRSNKTLSFSPWPECQGRQWRFHQFFKRIFGG